MARARDIRRSRGERGASIIIALVFLMVCATVAAVVVVGASVNSDRTRKETAEQQGYFALNSALNEAKGMWATEDPMKSLVVTVNGSTVSATANSSYADNAVANWAVQQIKDMKSGLAVTPLTVTVTGTNPNSNQALPEVTLTYEMGTSYAITITGAVDSATGYTHKLTTTIKATTSTSSPTTIDWKSQ
ncbi:MAG: hypothetical protein LKE37_08430 [Atopobiaceae bacterium]|nr:hypothetical protein [Atopobiaceae bacterium]